jgi:hypothetical protein
MLTKTTKAEAVLAALEEASPQLLVHLVESGELKKKLTDRVKAFNLQFARMMENRDPRESLDVVESLMPMLTEFPRSQDQTPLTPEQRQAVETTLDQWLDEQPKSVVINSLVTPEASSPDRNFGDDQPDCADSNQPRNPKSVRICECDGVTASTTDAKIMPDGSLQLSGYDIGKAAEQFIGHDDYEYDVIVKSEDKDALLLALLADRFRGDSLACTHFKQYLDAKSIQYDFDTWP